MKQVLAILTAMLLLLGLMPAAVVSAADEPVIFSLTSDKTEATVGEEITFTVSMIQTGAVAAIQLELVVPAGMTYVPNSTTLDANLAANLGGTTESLEFIEETRRLVWADPIRYWVASEQQTVPLLTFKATVDADAVDGAADVTLTYTEATDSAFRIREHRVMPATVTLRTGNTAAPTESRPDDADTPATGHIDEAAGDPAEEKKGSAVVYVVAAAVLVLVAAILVIVLRKKR